MSPLSSPALEVIRANARYLLRESLESIHRQDPYEQSGRPYFEAAWFYRRMALCELLADANEEAFFAHLCRSTQVRIHFLNLVSQGHPAQTTYICASKNFSFIDALVAGNLKSALEIARLTTTHHERSCEYEEDFLLHHFLHAFTIHLRDGAEYDFHTLLKRWKRALQGDSSCYLQLCHALWARDSSLFGEALLDAVEQRQRVFAERKSDPAARDTLLTEAPIYMTGLAFLRIAELRGMSTREEYPTLPSLARLPMNLPPPQESSWSTLMPG